MPMFLLGMGLIMLTAADEPPRQVTGTIGGEVVLPYHSTAGYKRVYWQKTSAQTTKEKPVNALCPPAETDCRKIDPSYAGRSQFLANGTEGDFSLMLHNLTVGDEGIYKCVVVQGNDIFNEMVKLSVVANYSRPVVSSTGVRAGHVVNFTCTTSGGYPLATLEWVNGTSGGLLGEGPNPTSYSRDHHQLYLLSSVLQLRVGCGHLGTVTCRIRTQAREILWSTRYQGEGSNLSHSQSFKGSASGHSAPPLLSSTITVVSLLVWLHL